MSEQISSHVSSGSQEGRGALIVLLSACCEAKGRVGMECRCVSHRGKDYTIVDAAFDAQQDGRAYWTQQFCLIGH